MQSIHVFLVKDYFQRVLVLNSFRSDSMVFFWRLPFRPVEIGAATRRWSRRRWHCIQLSHFNISGPTSERYAFSGNHILTTIHLLSCIQLGIQSSFRVKEDFDCGRQHDLTCLFLVDDGRHLSLSSRL